MENSVVSARKKFTMEKFVSQAKVTAENPIKKILNVSARSSVLSSECLGGMTAVTGKVFVNVLYISQEGSIERAGAQVDFANKQQTEFSLEDAFASDEVEVSSVNNTSTEILVSLTHQTTLSGTYSYEISNFEDSENDLVMSKKNFVAMKKVMSASDNFVVTEECESNLKNLKILEAHAKAVILEAATTVDKVVLEGKIVSEVFVTDGENFETVSKEFDFKQEILTDGTVPSMISSADVAVKNITVSPEESEEKVTLSYAFDIYAAVSVYEETNYSAVTDMFSLSNEIKTENSYIEAKNYHSALSVSDSIMMTANVSEIENFDDIAGVYGARFEFVSSEDLGDKLAFSGRVSATALVKVLGGYDTLDVSSETYFEIAKDATLISEGVRGSVQILSFKVKAGKELEVAAKVSYSVKFDTSISEAYVSAFEKVKAKNASNSGIKVYVASQGETLFDVAKALSVRPEVVSNQNEVFDVFEQGEKIYIYSPINLI